jgi:predicted metal-binding membrane protein
MTLLRREQAPVVAALLLVLMASWAYLWTGAGTMTQMGDMLMPMSSGPWTAAHATVMLTMWVVMMMAMMLPSAMPMILLYASIARGYRAKGQDVGSVAVFVSAYALVWATFSVAATALQFALERLAVLSPMMALSSTAVAGALLIAAGVYQWTPWKQACLRHCRSPLEFVLTQWRAGIWGAFEMGLRHGAYCLGCCWMLMLLLFVGGIMSLGWIAGLALLVLVEKLAPLEGWSSRGVGLVLVAWGWATLGTVV